MSTQRAQQAGVAVGRLLSSMSAPAGPLSCLFRIQALYGRCINSLQATTSSPPACCASCVSLSSPRTSPPLPLALSHWCLFHPQRLNEPAHILYVRSRAGYKLAALTTQSNSSPLLHTLKPQELKRIERGFEGCSWQGQTRLAGCHLVMHKANPLAQCALLRRG